MMWFVVASLLVGCAGGIAFVESSPRSRAGRGIAESLSYGRRTTLTVTIFALYLCLLYVVSPYENWYLGGFTFAFFGVYRMSVYLGKKYPQQKD